MKIKPRSNKNPKGEALFRCPFPNCGSIFAKESGKPETCLKHRALIADVMFILDHTKTPEAGPGIEKEKWPVLLVPKPGMSDQAIEEALKNQKGGKNNEGLTVQIII